MTLTEKADLMREKLTEVATLQAEILHGIHELIKTTPDLDGVTPIPNDNGIRMAVVKFSTLKSENNWCPRHFITGCQIDRIMEQLENKTTVTQIVTYLRTALDTGYIKKGTDKITINSNIRKSLTEAYELLSQDELIK